MIISYNIRLYTLKLLAPNAVEKPVTTNPSFSLKKKL